MLFLITQFQYAQVTWYLRRVLSPANRLQCVITTLMVVRRKRLRHTNVKCLWMLHPSP